MPVPSATLRQRIDYGQRVLGFAAGVLKARAGRTPAPAAADPASAIPSNAMFRRDHLPRLDRFRRRLQSFDLYLFDIVNSSRLCGEKVFEYGTMLDGIRDWDGLRVLDVGTGRSTLPQWMVHEGARVVSFDLPMPAEDRWGGFQKRVNAIIARRSGPVTAVSGSMCQLPYADGSFDLVTSLSVVEHLDTNFPDRAYVPYDEQRRRLADVLEEAIRVTAPGGHIYVTSECCDYTRATTDTWRQAYYYTDGPALSAAWPVQDVPALFYDFVKARGCTLVGGVEFDAAQIQDPERWLSRGPYFSVFSMLARKNPSGRENRASGS
jgi:SAM-dependent methyltransferase